MATDKERIAALEECVERLEKDLAGINKNLSSLLTLLQQSRGILRFLQCVALGIAGLTALMVSVKELFPSLFK